MEECVKIARQSHQLVLEKAIEAPSQNSGRVASGTGVPGKATEEAQEVLFSSAE
jgi:hypothetical protein